MWFLQRKKTPIEEKRPNKSHASNATNATQQATTSLLFGTSVASRKTSSVSPKRKQQSSSKQLTESRPSSKQFNDSRQFTETGNRQVGSRSNSPIRTPKGTANIGSPNRIGSAIVKGNALRNNTSNSSLGGLSNTGNTMQDQQNRNFPKPIGLYYNNTSPQKHVSNFVSGGGLFGVGTGLYKTRSNLLNTNGQTNMNGAGGQMDQKRKESGASLGSAETKAPSNPSKESNPSSSDAPYIVNNFVGTSGSSIHLLNKNAVKNALYDAKQPHPTFVQQPSTTFSQQKITSVRPNTPGAVNTTPAPKTQQIQQSQVQQQQVQHQQVQQQQVQQAQQQQAQQQHSQHREEPAEPNPEVDFPELGTDRFEIKVFIGSGGEGVVYEAYDTRERLAVALKVGNRHEKGKGFEKELTIYNHTSKVKTLQVPRLLDYRVNGIDGASGEFPDYLALQLLGPSLRMMLQSCLQYRAQQMDKSETLAKLSKTPNTMELRSIYNIADQMLNVLEGLHKHKVLHHDVKPQNVVFKSRERSLESDIVNDKDELALIDLGMSYFVAENTKPKRHCRFCGSMDYSSRASRYRCQPSRRDDLESLGYLLLWLVMGNRSYKAWRSAVLEPYWEMLSPIYEERSDINEILGIPSHNSVPYEKSLEHANDTNKVFIRRSAVQQKNTKQPKTADKKCDLGLFQTNPGSRPDDVIEGNLPKLNREKVPEKILYFILYCQTLGFAEVPDYAALKKLFNRSHNKDLGRSVNPYTDANAPTGILNEEFLRNELTIASSNSEPIPDWMHKRMMSHSLVKDEITDPTGYGPPKRSSRSHLTSNNISSNNVTSKSASHATNTTAASGTHATPHTSYATNQHALSHATHTSQNAVTQTSAPQSEQKVSSKSRASNVALVTNSSAKHISATTLSRADTTTIRASEEVGTYNLEDDVVESRPSRLPRRPRHDVTTKPFNSTVDSAALAGSSSGLNTGAGFQPTTNGVNVESADSEGTYNLGSLTSTNRFSTSSLKVKQQNYVLDPSSSKDSTKRQGIRLQTRFNLHEERRPMVINHSQSKLPWQDTVTKRRE